MKDLKNMRCRNIFGLDILAIIDSAIANLQLFGTMLENNFDVHTAEAAAIVIDGSLMSKKVETLLQIIVKNILECSGG